MNTQVNSFGVVVLAVIGSGGFWVVLQFLLNFRGRRAEAGRMHAAEEKDREDARKAEAERLAFIQQVERTAYDRAKVASDEAYGRLEKRCDECFDELAGVRKDLGRERRARDALLDAALDIVALLDPTTPGTQTFRAAIQTAREARYDDD